MALLMDRIGVLLLLKLHFSCMARRRVEDAHEYDDLIVIGNGLGTIKKTFVWVV